MLLRNADIWQAIDALARDHGFSASGLAQRAGLDSTSFNKSKRVSRDGRRRWPSLESVSKILDATGVSALDFFGFSASKGDSAASRSTRRLPAVGLRQAVERDPFDALGLPKGKLWDEIPFPELTDRAAYGIRVAGDSWEPVYCDGGLVVMSPQAAVRRGDRVLVRTINGRLYPRLFQRRTTQRLETQVLAGSPKKLTFDAREIAFVHRIVWASQ
jgi:phage repressor protein C with HTH and peptisase S24 domain